MSKKEGKRARAQETVRRKERNTKIVVSTAVLAALLAILYAFGKSGFSAPKVEATSTLPPPTSTVAVPEWMQINDDFTASQTYTIIAALTKYDESFDCSPSGEVIVVDPMENVPQANGSVSIELSSPGHIEVSKTFADLYGTILHAATHACASNRVVLDQPWTAPDGSSWTGYENYSVTIVKDDKELIFNKLEEGLADMIALSMFPGYDGSFPPYREVRKLAEAYFGDVPAETLAKWRKESDIPAMIRYAYGYPETYVVTNGDVYGFMGEFQQAFSAGEAELPNP